MQSRAEAPGQAQEKGQEAAGGAAGAEGAGSGGAGSAGIGDQPAGDRSRQEALDDVRRAVMSVIEAKGEREDMVLREGGEEGGGTDPFLWAACVFWSSAGIVAGPVQDVLRRVEARRMARGPSFWARAGEVSTGRWADLVQLDSIGRLYRPSRWGGGCGSGRWKGGRGCGGATRWEGLWASTWEGGRSGVGSVGRGGQGDSQAPGGAVCACLPCVYRHKVTWVASCVEITPLASPGQHHDRPLLPMPLRTLTLAPAEQHCWAWLRWWAVRC